MRENNLNNHIERERIEGIFHPRGAIFHPPLLPPESLDVGRLKPLRRPTSKEEAQHTFHRMFFYATAFPIGLLFLAAAPLLTAFEAHVVNVTAKIERRPSQCDARSLGYWANHEGCKKGQGESEHTDAVHEISGHYEGVFSGITGGEICEALWMPNCGGGNTLEGAYCRAQAHTLADILNIAALHLDEQALIAGAVDDADVFGNLGLTPFSTLAQALAALEHILADPDATVHDLKDAAHVAARIYSFYENENPFAPQCITDPDDVPQCLDQSFNIRIENENNAVVETNVSVSANTGGNTVGEGGVVITGDASASSSVSVVVNMNETSVNVGCGTCAGESGISTDTQEVKDVELGTPAPIEDSMQGDGEEETDAPAERVDRRALRTDDRGNEI